MLSEDRRTPWRPRYPGRRHLLNGGIEREALPTCQRYSMSVLVWSRLAMGLLTGRYRKGEPVHNQRRMHRVPMHMIDERKLKR